jgi:hypothetical protein
MSDPKNHGKVDFCQDMTLTYKDSLGVLKFVFELGANVKNKELIIYKDAVDASLKDITKTPDNSDRLNNAFQQVVDYAQSLGYKIEVI